MTKLILLDHINSFVLFDTTNIKITSTGTFESHCFVGMAYSQNFSDHLLRQLNESDRRNLELQSLLAHKDDHLAGANAQLQRALSAATANPQPSLVQDLQKQNHDFQGQLRHSKQAIADGQRKLNERTEDFNAIYIQQQQQVLELQQKLSMLGPDTRDIMQVNETAKVVALEKDLARANTELQRLRIAYSKLQKQLDAEKKQSARGQSFPATTAGKTGKHHQEDDDMDDEEPSNTWIKQEVGTASMPKATPKPPSMSSKKTMPSPSMPPKQVQPSSQPQPNRKTSSSTSLASRPNATKLAMQISPTATPPLPETKKRRRSLDSELDSELRDLEIYSPLPRKRSRRSMGYKIDVNTSSIREKFHFKAIIDYDQDDGIRYLLSTDPEDIVDDCQIWDDVKLLVDSWEEAKGECWAYEFEDRMRGRDNKCCVSSKLKVEGRPTGRTSWRSGGKGRYACGRCVEEGKPCFTWDGEGFRLLPLGDEDRDPRWPVQEGFEVRYWVNGE